MDEIDALVSLPSVILRGSEHLLQIRYITNYVTSVKFSMCDTQNMLTNINRYILGLIVIKQKQKK